MHSTIKLIFENKGTTKRIYAIIKNILDEQLGLRKIYDDYTIGEPLDLEDDLLPFIDGLEDEDDAF